MIEVQVQPLDPRDERIEAEWRLLETLAKPSFFLSWDWTGSLLATLPARSISLLRLSDGSQTVGQAYLGRERTVRHLIVWSERLYLNAPGELLTIEDNLLLARPELETVCWDALLRWFAHEQNVADELVLQGLRQPLELAATTCYPLRYDHLPLQSYHVDLKRLEETAGGFSDLLSKNARYQLHRSIRDYGGSGALQLREAGSIEEALAWFDNMKVLHSDSWARRGKPHAFSRPFFETFHRNLIRRTFAAGRIQMLRVDAGGEPIAYLYNFRDGLRTYAYQSGFADKDRRLRPGAVSHALAIEHNFRLGVRLYDFMAGNNRLKSSFATGCRDMHWTTVQLPRIRFRLENVARHAKHRFCGDNRGN